MRFAYAVDFFPNCFSVSCVENLRRNLTDKKRGIGLNLAGNVPCFNSPPHPAVPFAADIKHSPLVDLQAVIIDAMRHT